MAFVSTALGAWPHPAVAARPNIVFFLVDDMGWQETSVPFHTEATELNRRYHTPNMERLAAQGMKFTQAYASAVCSPTRVSALTGMNAARHRVTNWTLRKNASPDNSHKTLSPPQWNVNGICTNAGVERTMQVTPLPALLRGAGYRTIHVGKAHFGAKETPGENPLNLGFDVNIAGHAAGGPGSYWGAKNFSAAWRTKPPDLIWDVPGLEAYHGTNIFLTEALTLEALKQVEKAVAEKQPFYLYLSHYAVHAPWEQDGRFHQKYLDAGLKPFDATLASMIEGMDKSLGDVMAALDRLGVADNTIILFLSDNGSPSQCPPNLPLRGHKLTPYEGGTRVPMLARWPGVTQPASVCREPVIVEDFFPTILELAGVNWAGKTVQTVDGVSFAPLLKGDGRHGERALIWHFPNNYSGQGPFSAIRVAGWKLVYHYADRRLELFNLAQDLSEKVDLAAKEPRRVRELAAKLTALLKERDAQRPTEKTSGQPVPWPDETVPGAALALSAAKARVPFSSLARGLEWRGVALEEPDFTLWDVSPNRDADGKVHLFVGRWPEKNVDPAWRKSSEIAHYIGDRPEGPFRFRDVVLRGTGSNTWDKFAPHNPEVRQFGDTFALTYIANDDFRQPPHPRNQRIGLAVSKSLDGPWHKVGRDGLILESSPDTNHWTFGSQIVNPTLCQVGGKFHLYFKSRCQGQPGTVYGVAIADQLEGPYHLAGGPLTTKGVMIEDGFVFEWQGKICLISTDNHGGVTGIRGGGALWVSEDGLKFNPTWTQVAYDRIPAYFHDYDPQRVKKIYGSDPKLERPKLLLEEGRPAWLYAPSGWNVTGGERTAIHLLRVELKPGDGPLPPRKRVACLGDSITFGAGANPRETQSYPAQLARMLGSDFEVRNFGVGGCTLLSAGDKPYRKQAEFQAALQFDPDIVVVMLGVNDTCAAPRGNWEKSAAFPDDARELLRTLQRPGRQVIVGLPALMLPATPGLKPERKADLEARLPRLEKIRAWWRDAARDCGAGTVDLGGTLEADTRLVTDGVHPTADGYERIAQRFFEHLTGSFSRVSQQPHQSHP